MTFREVWKYRELFYFLASRDVKIRYKQTLLGVLWVIIQPLSTMVIFTVLFGRVAGLPSDGTPHPVFYLAALLPWTYFSTNLVQIGNSLVGNSGLLTKVYFPRMILPASVALAGLLDMLIGSVCLVAVMIYYRIPATAALVLWPFLVVLLFLLTLGIGMILAALNVKYRDIKYAIPFAVQILLFLTPIIYPASLVTGRYRLALALNPLSGLIEAFRFSIVPTTQMDWSVFGVSVLATVALSVGGVWYFHRTERAFADIV
jgi:lipopolysaccharide transport system permease protein